MSDDILNMREGAKMIRISERKLASLVRSGVIPSIRVGARSVRLSKAALERWLQQQPSAARDAEPVAAAAV